MPSPARPDFGRSDVPWRFVESSASVGDGCVYKVWTLVRERRGPMRDVRY